MKSLKLFIKVMNSDIVLLFLIDPPRGGYTDSISMRRMALNSDNFL